ncbi:hypothetical protein BHM03_00042866 [Ensete ventricosum]|nr:hypothetical protein BHM03_00042866 [Ensete ventricosum]
MASPLLLSISTPFVRFRRRYLYPHNIAAPPLRYPSSLAFLNPIQSRNLWGTNSSNSLHLFGRAHARGTPTGGAESETPILDEARVGEDSAAFELGEQRLSSWAYFTAVLGAVLVALNVLWINPSTGFGKAYIDAVSGLSPSPEVSLDKKLLTCRRIGKVAAVDKPKLHLWETGIMRITRHPQIIWCLAHTIWIGNTVAMAASVGLIAHHIFGVWNGDRRLALRYGQDFEALKSRTRSRPVRSNRIHRQHCIEPRDHIQNEAAKHNCRPPSIIVFLLVPTAVTILRGTP